MLLTSECKCLHKKIHLKVIYLYYWKLCFYFAASAIGYFFLGAFRNYLITNKQQCFSNLQASPHDSQSPLTDVLQDNHSENIQEIWWIWPAKKLLIFRTQTNCGICSPMGERTHVNWKVPDSSMILEDYWRFRSVFSLRNAMRSLSIPDIFVEIHRVASFCQIFWWNCGSCAFGSNFRCRCWKPTCCCLWCVKKVDIWLYLHCIICLSLLERLVCYVFRIGMCYCFSVFSIVLIFIFDSKTNLW